MSHAIRVTVSLLLALILPYFACACTIEKIISPDSNQGKSYDIPTLTEMSELYGHAKKALFWFYVDAQPDFTVDYSNRVVSVGIEYYLCYSSEISSMDELTRYLKDIFTDDYVSRLNNESHPKFIERNGLLYYINATGTTNTHVGKDRVCDIKQIANDKIEIIVMTEILDDNFEVTGESEHTFSLTYKSGSWLFDSFYLTNADI